MLLMEEQERKHAKRLQSQKEQLDSQREQHDGELRNLQLEMDRYRKAHQEQFDRHREEHEGELRAVRTSLEREMDKHREAQQQELASHRGKHDDNLRSVHAILKQNKLEQEDQRRYFGIEPPLRLRTLVTERYRMTIYHGNDWGEIYDLSEDPGEINNLWGDKASQKLKADLLEIMSRRQMALTDLGPLPTRVA